MGEAKRLALWYVAAAVGMVVAQFEYHQTDEFDQIEHMFRVVTPENCHIKPLVSVCCGGGVLRFPLVCFRLYFFLHFLRFLLYFPILSLFIPSFIFISSSFIFLFFFLLILMS